MLKYTKHLFLVTIALLGGNAIAQDSIPVIPPQNQQILDTIAKYGRSISPTYEEAVCTEFVLGILEHFVVLSKTDRMNVRIDQPRKNLDEVYDQMESGSPFPKGVYYALTNNGMGEAIDDWTKVLPGDFVQFWYPHSWGHCGIVSSLELENGIMWLHSSYPSTDGYGVQPFQIPEYTWFVRLKPID